MTIVTPYTLGITPWSYRIRVGVKVIEELQYPKRIRLLINPEKMQLLVQPCDIDELCSFKVSFSRITGRRHGPEINSSTLVRILIDRMELKANESYRVYGKLDKANNQVLFDLNNFCVIDAANVKENE